MTEDTELNAVAADEGESEEDKPEEVAEDEPGASEVSEETPAASEE